MESLAHRWPSAVRIGANALDFFHHITVGSKILFEIIRFVDATVIGNTTESPDFFRPTHPLRRDRCLAFGNAGTTLIDTCPCHTHTSTEYTPPFRSPLQLLFLLPTQFCKAQ
jgi:hypothetical protein